MDLAGVTLNAEHPDGNMIQFRPLTDGDAEMIRDVYQYQHYDFSDLKVGR